MRNKYPSFRVPYVEAHYKVGKQKPTAILLTTSGTTANKGSAYGIARNWHTRMSPHQVSHYVVDAETTFQCVPDKMIAGRWDCAEKGLLAITVCSEWLSSLDQWNDLHGKAMARAVDLVAHLVLTHKIKPVVHLDDYSVKHWLRWKRRSRGGIFVRIEGMWPVQTFQTDLLIRIEEIKKEGHNGTKS